MNVQKLAPLTNPPIIEAVLDIDCDFPTGTEFKVLIERAKSSYDEDYPHLEYEKLFENKFQITGETVERQSSRNEVRCIRFFKEDRKQIVQIRKEGFSFNRLTPYTTLQDYLQEIEKCWLLYCNFSKPVSIKEIKLRYINKLHIQTDGKNCNLDEYLSTGPKSPDPDNLSFTGFVQQHFLFDKATKHQASVILISQPSEKNSIPVILDITAIASNFNLDPLDWNSILEKIQELRKLINNIFYKMVTEKCLQQHK